MDPDSATFLELVAFTMSTTADGTPVLITAKPPRSELSSHNPFPSSLNFSSSSSNPPASLSSHHTAQDKISQSYDASKYDVRDTDNGAQD